MCLKFAEDHGSAGPAVDVRRRHRPSRCSPQAVGAAFARHPADVDDILHPQRNAVEAAAELPLAACPSARRAASRAPARPRTPRRGHSPRCRGAGPGRSRAARPPTILVVVCGRRPRRCRAPRVRSRIRRRFVTASRPVPMRVSAVRRTPSVHPSRPGSHGTRLPEQVGPPGRCRRPPARGWRPAALCLVLVSRKRRFAANAGSSVSLRGELSIPDHADAVHQDNRTSRKSSSAGDNHVRDAAGLKPPASGGDARDEIRHRRVAMATAPANERCPWAAMSWTAEISSSWSPSCP